MSILDKLADFMLKEDSETERKSKQKDLMRLREEAIDHFAQHSNDLYGIVSEKKRKQLYEAKLQDLIRDKIKQK
jgi:hypothetical protein